MGRRRYRSCRRSRTAAAYDYRPRSVGLDRALRHIEEARQLSIELGGTDKDVKAYFFSLPQQQLRVILDAYESIYGRERREYAEATLPKWRAGKVQMSGLVAGRLFDLLPPRMPLSKKYELTENLWRHVGPSSKKVLRVGIQADVDQALAVVREHIESVVAKYKIPEALERRFNWISSGDVSVKQELLNHLQQMEKALVVDGAKRQLPVMLRHMGSIDGDRTHRMAQILKVGKHELEIVVDKQASGVKLEEAASMTSSSAAGSYAWILWVVAIAAVGYLLSL